MLTLDYVQDPGHGWISADHQSLDRLGILGKVSSYSYRDGDLVWLEEDCDAGLYLRALKDAGIPYQVKETHTKGDAWIRSLPRFVTFNSTTTGE